MKEAIEVIKTENKPVLIANEKDKENQVITENEFFKVERIQCDKVYKDSSDINTFCAITIVDGKGKIKFNKKEYKVKKGTSFLVPASLGSYTLEGKMVFLKSYLNKFLEEK